MVLVPPVISSHTNYGGPHVVAQNAPAESYFDRALSLIEKSREETSEKSNYLDFHRERLQYVVRLCERLWPAAENARVLDIGRSELSRLLAERFRNLETMGFALSDDAGGHTTSWRMPGAHHVFDLNQAWAPDQWPAAKGFDVIVMAEVIEHLHTAPELVLTMLNSMLAPGGYLIVQTPNAAAIHKRLKLLLGKNPNERIRPYHMNPGHFREYTKAELIEIGRAAGLETVLHEYVDYFGCTGGGAKRLLNAVYKATLSRISGLRRGQTIVYRRA